MTRNSHLCDLKTNRPPQWLSQGSSTLWLLVPICCVGTVEGLSLPAATHLGAAAAGTEGRTVSLAWRHPEGNGFSARHQQRHVTVGCPDIFTQGKQVGRDPTVRWLGKVLPPCRLPCSTHLPATGLGSLSRPVMSQQGLPPEVRVRVRPPEVIGKGRQENTVS